MKKKRKYIPKYKKFNIFYSLPSMEHEAIVTASSMEDALEQVRKAFAMIDQDDVSVRPGWEIF